MEGRQHISLSGSVFIATILFSPIIAAEETDMFSRANCINNESISYNFFEPAQWRLTFSTHIRSSTSENHYVASGPFVGCDYMGCWYAYEYMLGKMQERRE